MGDGRVPRVTEGGFWNAPAVNYSPQTRELLNVMMKESKLTNLQQRKINSSVASGRGLPDPNPPPPKTKRKPMPQKGKPLNPKNYSSTLRSKQQIEESGAYEKPIYRPRVGVPGRSNNEKDRLANMMAFGMDIDPSQKMKQARPPTPDSPPPLPDRFDELVEEIEERKNFLENMETLGKGKQYRSKIETEISQMVREMEIIDKRRTAEMHAMESKIMDGD